VAAGATAVLNGPGGIRRVPVGKLATGPGRTVIRRDEWIETIEVPLPAGEEGFRKFGTRKADAVSVVSLAWRWRRTADGRLHDVSVALGAVAPTVVRARSIDRAMAALRSEISPIDDFRTYAQYRREVAGVMLREVLSARARPEPGSQMST
jgi:CO/xanthine dehydrogenase FAD-binding subunit